MGHKRTGPDAVSMGRKTKKKTTLVIEIITNMGSRMSKNSSRNVQVCAHNKEPNNIIALNLQFL